MSLLKGRKSKEAETQDEGVKHSPPLAPAADEELVQDGPNEGAPRPNEEAGWVRLGGDALWVGALPDDLSASGDLGSRADATTEQSAAPAEPPRTAAQEPSVQPDTPPPPEMPVRTEPGKASGHPLELAAARTPDVGTPEFRILSGATTPDEIGRRFSWKTDYELAGSYELALQESKHAAKDDAELAYWEAIAEALVAEAASRPTFGELNEWEDAEDGRERRQKAKRLQALATARDALLRSNSSS
jgi:hypothetical protein